MSQRQFFEKIDTRILISTLWIVIMFNMAFADILSFMIPGSLQAAISGTVDGVNITEELMLIAALILEIPIAMILLSRTLKWKMNRNLNIAAALITIAFVVGGGSLALHYIFLGGIEVICLLLIIRIAWTWKEYS